MWWVEHDAAVAVRWETVVGSSFHFAPQKHEDSLCYASRIARRTRRSMPLIDIGFPSTVWGS